MAVSGTDSILGQYEANLNAQANTDRIATDKNTFLKLLVAQLTHQDPLNPVEDKEFIAQLAQFTTVEELQNISSGMETLNSAYLRQQSVSAAGLIGQYIEAPGNMVTIIGIGTDTSHSSYINFDLPRDADSFTLNISSLDADGNPSRLVATRDLGPVSAGDGQLQWDGKDNNGIPMTDGIYHVTIVAKDIDGANIYVPTSSTGKVIRVETSEDGNHNLVLQDLRSVKFNDVKLIDDPVLHESANSTTKTEAQTAYEAAAKAAQTAQTAAETARTAADEAAAAAAANPTDENLKKAAEEAAEKADKAEEAAEEAAKVLEAAAKKVLEEATA